MTPASASPTAVRKTRLKAVIFLLLSCTVGAGAVYLVKGYMDAARSGIAPVRERTSAVVVAGGAIPIGTVLADQNVAVVRWPAGEVPEGSFSSPSEVTGRTVLQGIVKGEPILAERLADLAAGQGLRALLKPGARAMAVKVDQVVGVAGFVKPGDRVDVVATMAPDEDSRRILDNEAARISKIILQNVAVLAIGEQTSSQGSKPVNVHVVTLEVTPEQSERLALASRHGDIQLILRSLVDLAPVATAGITPAILLAPDEGSVPAVEVAGEPLRMERPVGARRTTRGKTVAEEPVVEILRGTRVEQRKLRATQDSTGTPSGAGEDR